MKQKNVQIKYQVKRTKFMARKSKYAMVKVQ